MPLRYRFVDSQHEFPGPEVVDIFYKVARETVSAKSIRTFVYFWEARSRGEDVTSQEFQQRLASLAASTA